MALPEYSGLRVFADGSDKMDADGDAGCVMRDTRHLWPEVKHVSVARVQALKRGLMPTIGAPRRSQMLEQKKLKKARLMR